MEVTAVDMPLVKIGKAAELLSVSVQTLRKWDSGELVPDRRSEGGVRYYDMGKILGLGSEDMPTIGYARVSSHDQKNDLVRQQELLEAFCAAKARSDRINAGNLIQGDASLRRVDEKAKRTKMLLAHKIALDPNAGQRLYFCPRGGYRALRLELGVGRMEASIQGR